MPKKLKFTRLHFETAVSKHHRLYKDVQDLYNKEILKPQDPLFTLEDLIAICRIVGKGMWENAGLLESPNSKWGQEYRSKVINRVILEAFAA